jgi:hypothetical protein
VLANAFRRLTGRRPPLVVCPVNGIGNRMRAIASADAFARRHGLALSMCWQPSSGFSDVAFETLFANEIPRLSPADVDALAAAGVSRSRDCIRFRSGQWQAAPGFDPETALAGIRAHGFIYDGAFMDLFSLLAGLRVRGIAREGRAVRRAYRRFRVALPIARAADRFAEENFRKRRVVGVHVRRGDAMLDVIAAEFAASSDAAFEREMDQELATAPETFFFLATDDPAILVQLEKRYPGRILAVRKEFVASEVDAPKDGQIDALLELTLLSRTRWILGTSGSTFGRAAARLGGVPYRKALEAGAGGVLP